MKTSLQVLDEFFGWEFGTAGGPGAAEVLALPPEQLHALALRILESSRDRFFASGVAGRREIVVPVGLDNAWWEPTRAAEIGKIKRLACYVPHTYIPDPLWDAVEELASFAIILKGGDPRRGLIKPLHQMSEIKTTYGRDDVFRSNVWVYPSAALMRRVQRMEAAGNDARPLLTSALRALSEIRPLLDAGSLELMPYPDARSGLRHSYKLPIAMLRKMHELVCKDGPNCSYLAPGETDSDGGHEELDEGASASFRALVAELDHTTQAYSFQFAIDSHLDEEGIHLPDGFMTHLMHLPGSVVSLDQPSGDQIFQYFSRIGRATSSTARTAARLTALQVPTLETVGWSDIADMVQSEGALVDFRQRLGSALRSAPPVTDDDTLGGYVQAVQEELRPLANKTTRSIGKRMTSPNLAAGMVAVGVGAAQYWSKQTIDAELLLAIAAGQVPWVAEVLEARRSLSHDRITSKIIMAFLEDAQLGSP